MANENYSGEESSKVVREIVRTPEFVDSLERGINDAVNGRVYGVPDGMSLREAVDRRLLED